MTRRAFYWSLLLGLVLLSFPQRGQAEQEDQHTAVAQRVAKGKVAQRSPRAKMPSKNRRVHNMLYPFTLRVLYTPSYRFLTKNRRDEIEEHNNRNFIMEVAQVFPLAAGLEGEFAFNQWVSLAVGGNFSWHDKFLTLAITNAAKEKSKKDGEEAFPGFDYNYYELVLGSSLYFNVFSYFKLGAGVELAFSNVGLNGSGTEKGKKYRIEAEVSWKRMSAHLALRRDFFWSGLGFGVGLNASMPVADVFDKKEEYKVYADGKQKEIENNNSSSSKDEDDDDEDFYSVVLMPMIYVAF